jgi:hypothetical protein
LVVPENSLGKIATSQEVPFSVRALTWSAPMGGLVRRKGIAAVVATVAVLVVVVVGSSQPATAVARDVAGTGWHTTPAAIPDQTRSGHLKAESCPTSSLCVAVGDQIGPRGIHTG